jgi:outer membrane protein
MKPTKLIKSVMPALSIVFFSGMLMGEISLEKAVQAGISQDSRYKNQLLDNAIAAENLQKARMKKFFSLDFNGSYLFKSEQMEISFLPGKTITAGSKNNYDVKLSVTQPIFTGGILSNSIALETEKQQVESYKTQLLEIELAGKIKASYFTFRLLGNKKKSLSLLLEDLKLHLKMLSDFYNEAQVKRSDVIETELKVSEVEMNMEDIDRMMEEEKINFKKLCTYNIEEIEKSYDEPDRSLDESLAYFKAHHPVLKMVDGNIRAFMLRKKIVSGSYLPQVSTFAELHYGKPGIDFFKNAWSLYFQGGLAVNFKVFDWNQLKREKEIVDKSIEQASNQKEESIAEVRKSLGQLYTKKASIDKQLSMLDKMIGFAEEDAGLKKELYKESQVSNTDYLSALLTKERYKSLRDERSVEFQLVKLNIDTLIGRNVDTEK